MAPFIKTRRLSNPNLVEIEMDLLKRTPFELTGIFKEHASA